MHTQAQYKINAVDNFLRLALEMIVLRQAHSDKLCVDLSSFSFPGSNFVLVDSPNSHIIQYVEFIGGDGSRFATSSPTEGGISASSMGSETILGPAVVPGESFFVRYRGLQNVTDSEGHTEAKPFKRYSSSALIPQRELILLRGK